MTLADIARQQQGVDDAVFSQLMAEDRRKVRRKNLLLVLVIAIVTVFSLHLTVTRPCTLVSPLDVLAAYGTWIKANIGGLIQPSLQMGIADIVQQQPLYAEICARAARTFIALICGALLALSGMLYQNTFRNPIAAPTMLGVSNGISMGILIMVMLYGSAATVMVGTRYLVCIACGALVLALVIGAGRFIGGKRGFSLVDMLLVGTIISSAMGTLITYATNYLFTDVQWSAYYDLSNVTDVDTSPEGMLLLTGIFLLCLIPIVVLRFRMNAIAFSDEDIRMLGINPLAMRAVALVSGSLMIMVAQLFAGAVSMLSLVVPFVTRALYGNEFRRQILGNILVGAAILIICRDLVDLIPFVGDGIPVGTMVSFVMLPAFAWVMAYAQKQWNDK